MAIGGNGYLGAERDGAKAGRARNSASAQVSPTRVLLGESGGSGGLASMAAVCGNVAAVASAAVSPKKGLRVGVGGLPAAAEASNSRKLCRFRVVRTAG